MKKRVLDNGSSSLAVPDKRGFVKQALNITVQDWSRIGMDDECCPPSNPSSSVEDTAERVTSLILVRLVALAAPSHLFLDFSSTTVCNTLIASDNMLASWPENITDTVIQELRTFVTTMLNGYNKEPQYHNFEHAYHVLVSCNKLMDLTLQSRASDAARSCSSSTLGFDEDPLMHLALLFAALIHDVEHQGVPNKQLVIENNPLAIQYNDQSVAEQRSLTIGFSELLKADYDNLREVMFPFTFAGDGYRRFRGAVTNLILATDIATPERSDVVKQKWKAAFVDKKQSKASRVDKTDRRRMLKKKTEANTSRPSLLPPPREHPTPMRGKKANVCDKPTRRLPPAPKLDLNESWVELGATPSTHFPRNTGPSMHDSMVFWWFCPSETDEDSDSHAGSSADTFASASTNSFDFSNRDLENSLHLSKGNFLVDVEKPPEDDGLSDSYYPSSSQSLQFSFSTAETEDLQHLLSPSKVCRLKRTVSQSSHKTASSSECTHPPPEGVGSYRDLTGSSSHDDDPAFDSNRSKGILSAFANCTPKRRPRRKSTTGLKGLKSLPSTDLDKSSDLMASSGNTVTTAVTAITDMSSPISASPSKILLDSSSVGEEAVDTFAEHTFDIALQEEETAPLAGGEEEEEEEVDEQLLTISLLEHILLVSDVAHNMQGWDVMIKFSHRLSKEIQSSITAGRSGGIMDDPLSDWYTNQSGFLHGYVKPLAERIEQTGCLGENGNLLTTMIDANLERWQEQGHDVIFEWRRLREKENKKKEKSKKKRTSKTTKKTKTSDDKKKRKSKTLSSSSLSSVKTPPKDSSTTKQVSSQRDVLNEQVLAPFGRLFLEEKAGQL